MLHWRCVAVLLRVETLSWWLLVLQGGRLTFLILRWICHGLLSGVASEARLLAMVQLRTICRVGKFLLFLNEGAAVAAANREAVGAAVTTDVKLLAKLAALEAREERTAPSELIHKAPEPALGVAKIVVFVEGLVLGMNKTVFVLSIENARTPVGHTPY